MATTKKRKHPGAVALGRLGGAVTSAKKAASARANGQLGGRPSMNKTPTCQTGTAFLSEDEKPCAGLLWESPRYYIKTGAALYKCEKHAKLAMTTNPFGPRFRARANGAKGGSPKKDTTRRLPMIAILALPLLLFAGCAMPQAILRDPVSGQTVNCTYMSEVNTPINSFPTRGSAGRAMGQGMADGIASAFREQECVNNYRAVGFQPMR